MDTRACVAVRRSDSYWGGVGVPGCAANPRELGDQLPVSVAHGDDGDSGEEQLSREPHSLVHLLSQDLRAEGGCTWAHGESRRVAGRWRVQVNGDVPDEEEPGQLASLSSD